jgi:hypothetical protein
MVEVMMIVTPILLLLLVGVVIWWTVIAVRGYNYVKTAVWTRGITSMVPNTDGTFSVAFSCPSNRTITVNDTYLMCADVNKDGNTFSPSCMPFNPDGSVISSNVIDVTSELAQQVNGQSGQVVATLSKVPNNPCTGTPCITWSINGSYDCQSAQ